MIRYILREKTIYVIEKYFKEREYQKVIDNISILQDNKQIDKFIVHYYLAQAYEGIKDYKNAIIYYEKVAIDAGLQYQPKLKQEAFLRIANMFMKTSKYIEALGYYNIALKDNPRNYHAIMNSAKILFKLKNFIKSKEYIKKFLLFNPNDVKARNLLAKIYYQLEEFPQAENEYHFVINNSEYNSKIQNSAVLGLSDTYIRLKNFLQAIDILQPLLHEEDLIDKVVLKMTTAYLHERKCDEAVQLLEENFGKLSLQYRCKVLYEIGKNYLNSNNIYKALELWRQIMDIDKNFSDVNSLLTYYDIFIKTPSLENIFTNDEKKFTKYIENKLRLSFDSEIIQKNNYCIFVDYPKCYVFYHNLTHMNLLDFNDLEKTLRENKFDNYEIILYSLFGLDEECFKMYLMKHLKLIQDKDFINVFK